MKLVAALETHMTVTGWLFERLRNAEGELQILFRRELINACSAHLSVIKRVVLPATRSCPHETVQVASAALAEVQALALSALADYITAHDATASHPSFVVLERQMDALRGIEMAKLAPAVRECLTEGEAEVLGQEVEADLEQFGGRRTAQLATGA